jgi:hypothetical protein
MKTKQYIARVVRDAVINESLRQSIRSNIQRINEQDDEPKDSSYNPDAKSIIHASHWRGDNEQSYYDRVKNPWSLPEREATIIALGGKISDVDPSTGMAIYQLKTFGMADDGYIPYESDILNFKSDVCLSVGFGTTMPWELETDFAKRLNFFNQVELQRTDFGNKQNVQSVPTDVYKKNSLDLDQKWSNKDFGDFKPKGDTTTDTQETQFNYTQYRAGIETEINNKTIDPKNLKIILKADADAAAGDTSCEGQQGYITSKDSKKSEVWFTDTCVIKIEMEEGDIWDKIANILDYIGFVPVIGDVADLINVIIYAAKGRWLECILSAIAIIPVVGSIIAMPVKALFKGTKKVRKALNKAMKSSDPTEIAKGWKEFEAIASKGMNPQQLKTVAEYMTKFPDLSKTWAVRNMDNVFGKKAQEEVAAVFENMHKFFKKGGETMIDTVKKGVDTKVAKAAADAGTDINSKLAKRFADIPYLKGGGSLGAIPNIGIGLVNKVKNWTMSSVMFTKKELKMLERSKEVLKTKYSNKLMNNNDELAKAMLTDPQYLKQMATGISNKNTLGNFYKIQKQIAKDPTQRRKIVDKLMANADSNPFFQQYRLSAKRQILSATGAYGSLTKNAISRMKMTKQLDVMYNELNGLMQSLGYPGLEYSQEDVTDPETGITTRTKTYTKQDYNLIGMAVGASFDAFTGPETKEQVKSYAKGALQLVDFMTGLLKLEILGVDKTKEGEYAAKRWVKESSDTKVKKDLEEYVRMVYDFIPGEDSDAKLNWAMSNIKDPEARKRAINIFAPTPVDDEEETNTTSKQ